METSVNLKRRRDSGNVHSKKSCPNTPPQQDPLEGPSNFQPQPLQQPQQKQSQKIHRQLSPFTHHLSPHSSSLKLFHNHSQFEVRTPSSTVTKKVGEELNLFCQTLQITIQEWGLPASKGTEATAGS